MTYHFPSFFDDVPGLEKVFGGHGDVSVRYFSWTGHAWKLQMEIGPFFRFLRFNQTGRTATGPAMMSSVYTSVITRRFTAATATATIAAIQSNSRWPLSTVAAATLRKAVD